jgi:hypothetical protein
MRRIGNRLLITLVLFGVLSAAAAHAQTISIGRLPAEPIGKSVYDQPSAPTAGEPDVGQTTPSHNGQTSTHVSSSTTTAWASSRTISSSYAQTLRWAWVIWMAQFLNQLP